MKSLMLLGFLSVVVGSTYDTTSSSDYLRCKGASRAISSVAPQAQDDNLTQEAQKVCLQEEKISSLKEDLDKLEIEKKRILTALEKFDDGVEKKPTEEASSRQRPQVIIINNSWPSLAQQLNTAPMISYGYSPFHNDSTQNLNQYLQMAMAQRLSFTMSAGDYWHPEWDSNGNMTNPQYGFGNTWSTLENMYRAPTAAPQYRSNSPHLY